MSLLPIEPLPGFAGTTGALQALADPFAPAAAPRRTEGAAEAFGGALAGHLESLQAAHSTVDHLAVQAATGQLEDVHDYTIAATQSQLATELTVTLRNKAVEAFNEILRMPV